MGRLSRDVQCWFPHLKQYTEAKAKNSDGYTSAKHVNASTCHVAFSIKYSLRTSFHSVHNPTYRLLMNGILLFLKGTHEVIVWGRPTELQVSTWRLRRTHRFSMELKSGETPRLILVFRYSGVPIVAFTKCRPVLYWLDQTVHAVTPPPLPSPKTHPVKTLADE